MTRNEAIHFLKQLEELILGQNSSLTKTKNAITESFDMAFEALKQQETMYYPQVDGITPSVITELDSAQPEIVRCNDCKNRETDDCPMYYEEWIEYDDDGYLEHDFIVHDNTKDAGFCDRGEGKDE